MTDYSVVELDALITAADRAVAHTPFNTDSGEFRAEAAALLPHVYLAIEHLRTTVRRYSGEHLHDRVLELLRLGHTQAELAKAANVGVSTISRIVNRGETRGFAADVAARIMALPVEPPAPPEIDVTLIEKLIAGERVKLPHGQRMAYAAAMTHPVWGLNVSSLARLLQISHSKATRAFQRGAA